MKPTFYKPVLVYFYFLYQSIQINFRWHSSATEVSQRVIELCHESAKHSLLGILRLFTLVSAGYYSSAGDIRVEIRIDLFLEWGYAALRCRKY